MGFSLALNLLGYLAVSAAMFAATAESASCFTVKSATRVAMEAALWTAVLRAVGQV